MHKRIVGALTIVATVFCIGPQPVRADETRNIVFPVLGRVNYGNDFGNARVGHTHEGNDIFGKKMQPLLAAVDGVARYVPYPEPSYGWYISIEDADGYRYEYIHINNDTPGTDNGNGGAMLAYAPGSERGWQVRRGQVIGYMGDSGNAETTPAHLHFEIRRPDDTPINPFASLQRAPRLSKAADSAVQSNERLPFGAFRVGTNVALGDVVINVPGNEVVVGAAVGSKPQIRIMSKDGQALGNFFLPIARYFGGVDVAVGDVNGDGVQEIIAGLGAGAEPLVFVLDRQGNILSRFQAYTSRFRGGLRVSAADLDGNGTAEIITGAGATGGPDVRTYTMTGQLLSSFYAYPARFRGGVDVAGVSAVGGGPGWIITGPGKGGGPDVRVYSQYGSLRSSSYAGDRGFRGGLRVAAATDPVTLQTSIFSVPASGGEGVVRSFTLDSVPTENWNMYERWWRGGFDVAADATHLFAGSADMTRRSSLMMQLRPVVLGL